MTSGTVVNLNNMLSEEQKDYIVRCAAIRQCSVSVLVRQLIRVIANDQMVLAVLDDDSQPLQNVGRPLGSKDKQPRRRYGQEGYPL